MACKRGITVEDVIEAASEVADVEGLSGVTLAAVAKRGVEGAEALRALAHAYRRFARRRPGLYAAVQRAMRPGEDDELYAALAAAVGPLIDALLEAGVSATDLIHMGRAVRSALHGFVELERASGFGMPESVEESFGRLVELLLSGVASAAGPRPDA